jgi:hypothetical protein
MHGLVSTFRISVEGDRAMRRTMIVGFALLIAASEASAQLAEPPQSSVDIAVKAAAKRKARTQAQRQSFAQRQAQAQAIAQQQAELQMEQMAQRQEAARIRAQERNTTNRIKNDIMKDLDARDLRVKHKSEYEKQVEYWKVRREQEERSKREAELSRRQTQLELELRRRSSGR